jgi:hypothetical protein
VNRFGHIRAELSGGRMHGDVCAELAGGGMNGFGHIRADLRGWRWGLGRGCLLGGSSFADFALRGKFAPVGDGERGRFLCHGVSSIFSIS